MKSGSNKLNPIVRGLTVHIIADSAQLSLTGLAFSGPFEVSNRSNIFFFIDSFYELCCYFFFIYDIISCISLSHSPLSY